MKQAILFLLCLMTVNIHADECYREANQTFDFWNAGIVRELFAIPIVFRGMVVQGIYGKTEESFDQSGNPILLSHGYLGTSGQFFYLKDLLKKNNAAVFTMDYESSFASIDDFAEAMKIKVEKIQQHYPGKKITIVGHSMGGIIAARYIANCVNTDHIAKVITLGSPLQGTYMAHVALGKCAREMERNSEYLNQLEQDLSTKNVSFINIGSCCDLIVLPNKSTAFKNAKSKKVTFKSMGHMTYLYSDRVADFLINELQNN